MGVTIREVVQTMVSRGYKVSERTLKYYCDLGLLPEPGKEGGYKSGVRLVFPDEDAVLSQLAKIFELKGRGFKLSEIRESFANEEAKAALQLRKRSLKQYHEINGRYYFHLDDVLGRLIGDRNSPYRYADSMGALLDEFIKVRVPASRDFVEKCTDEVEMKGLYITPWSYKGVLVYEIDDLYRAKHWIKLKTEYSFEWETLVSLYKKHLKNMKKYFFWPEPDGVRFSELSIKWKIQNYANLLGIKIWDYVQYIRTGGVLIDLDSPGFFSWDARYESVDDFVEDFLRGHCAFVPGHDEGQDMFLNRNS